MSHRDVRLDFNLAMETALGETGLRLSEIEALEAPMKEIHRGLMAMKEVGQLQFYQLPYHEEMAQEVIQSSQKLREKFDTLVVLGIGGSALGSKALISALQGPFWNELPRGNREGASKVIVCDHIDPDSLDQFLSGLDLKTTLFNVISKSGNTLETMSQMMIVADKLKTKLGAEWVRHFVVTTDPVKGVLRELVKEKKMASFAISPGVGGRFSVFSPVGLFPAAMAGVDLEDLLGGARRAEVRCRNEDVWLNPALMLALLHYLMFLKKRNLLVVMPYAESLKPLADWFCQLWAESIGKRFSLKGEAIQTGSTPVAALGPKDQHSQLQLYMEGPADKFILFLLFENFSKVIPIPHAPFNHEAFRHLSNHSLNEVLSSEALATAEALRSEGRPSAKLLIPHRKPYSIGQVLFLLEFVTAAAGGLFEVNPFDQPGVELGKKLAGGLLGKEGLESFRERILLQKPREQFVI